VKLKYWEKRLSQCKFVHHKSDMDLHGGESVPPQWRPETVWVTAHHQSRHTTSHVICLSSTSDWLRPVLPFHSCHTLQYTTVADTLQPAELSELHFCCFYFAYGSI
jgi:hypothetical protein